MSAVVGVPHPDWGEAVHAEIILREGMAADPEELVDFVNACLGSYKLPNQSSLSANCHYRPSAKCCGAGLGSGIGQVRTAESDAFVRLHRTSYLERIRPS